MTEPTNHRAGHRRHHHAGGSGMSDRALTIGVALVLGLAMLAVISQTGGSITVSTTELTATVNSSQ